MADNTVLNLGTLGDTVRDIDKAGIKTQVVALDIGGSGTESLVTFTNPHPVQSAATYFIFSASGQNTTTTQLAAAATFTGAIESIQSQQTISILLLSDQPGTLHLIQYIDAAGTQKTNDFTEVIAAGIPFSEAYTANGNYFRLTFVNNGAATTTTLAINTAYGTLPSVSSMGNGLTALNEVSGLPLSLGQVAMANSLPVTIANNQTALPTTQAAITKGVQGSTGVTTQDLKDAGRNARVFMLDAYTAAPVAEALQTVVQWYGNAAVAGTTTPAVVPAGKTLRITAITMSTKSLATVGSAVMRIRANIAGVAVIGSPLAYSVECGSRAGATTTAMTGGMGTVNLVIPDGLEFPAGTGLGFTLAGYGPTGTLTLEGVTRFVVTGFEY